MSIFNYSKIIKNKQYYIIAEIGVNHECSIKTAKKMIFKQKKMELMQQNFNFIKHKN